MCRPALLDLYAGAGGWGEGAQLAGLGSSIGLDTCLDACRTAQAAGHLRMCCDVATYPTTPFAGRVTGLTASPPCQAWSAAGQRLGELDRPRVHELVDRFASSDPTAEWAWCEAGWADPRSHHAAQSIRWIRDLRPEWVCLEQVPPVLPLWRHIGRVLTGWGYRAWSGLLCAADYGVPQTRTRAVLIASRVRQVGPPTPTHYDSRRGTAMFGEPWVSMASALGWGCDARPAPTVTGGGTDSGSGVEVFAGAHARAAVAYRNGNRERAAVRPLTEPAPTIHFGTNHNKVEWVVRTGNNSEKGGGVQERYERSCDEPAPVVCSTVGRWTVNRPATTVQGDPRISRPGHHDRDGGERQHTDSVKVTVTEAAILQGFRPDYPWQGSRTSQYTQVGNAIPPPLAAAVLAVAAGTPQLAEVA